MDDFCGSARATTLEHLVDRLSGFTQEAATRMTACGLPVSLPRHREPQKSSRRRLARRRPGCTSSGSGSTLALPCPPRAGRHGALGGSTKPSPCGTHGFGGHPPGPMSPAPPPVGAALVFQHSHRPPRNYRAEHRTWNPTDVKALNHSAVRAAGTRPPGVSLDVGLLCMPAARRPDVTIYAAPLTRLAREKWALGYNPDTAMQVPADNLTGWKSTSCISWRRLQQFSPTVPWRHFGRR